MSRDVHAAFFVSQRTILPYRDISGNPSLASDVYQITPSGIIFDMRKFFSCLALGLVALAASAQWNNPADDIPAFNAAPPTHPLPPILHGDQLTGPYFAHPYQVLAYKMAARIPAVLHQEPCYCRCDREMGHNSLHSCFEGTHGAACSTCMKEGVFAYMETKKGRTPAQIRAEIERGLWMNVDLEKAAL
jgi:hypothetical protein